MPSGSVRGVTFKPLARFIMGLDDVGFDTNMFGLTTPIKLRMARAIYRVITTIRPRLAQCPLIIRKRGGFVWELDLTEGIDLSIFLRGRFEAEVQSAFRRLVRPL